MEPAEILEKAADLLESGKLRWTQANGYMDGSGDDLGACAMGAVYYVAGCIEQGPQQNWNFLGTAQHNAAWEAEQAFRVQLPLQENGLHEVVESWNDDPERTLSEVVDTMKLAAKDVRNSGTASG